MADPLPVPTYADVAVAFKDPRTGKEKSKFNPVWLNWFLQINQTSSRVITLGVETAGVLPTDQGGAGVDISAYPSATIPLAKITGGGSDGFITIVNGIVSVYAPPS